MTTNNTPEGYRKDSVGRLVPLELIEDVDKMRDDLVIEKIGKMQALSAQLVALKIELINDIRAFVDVSAERYGVTIGGKGGNVTLNSFDGSAKLQLTIAKNLVFDERLQAAKVLVDNCIKRWSEGANENLHVLVDEAFQVDKEGKINTQRVLSLTRMNIDDKDWQAAMQAIKDSLSVLNTTTYVRGYIRNSQRPDDKLQPIVLDLAGV